MVNALKNLCTGSQEIAPHSIPGFDAIAPMALEPRFMFDAAGAATAADSAEQAQADAEAEQATQQESDTSSSNGDGSQSEDAATQQDVPASGSEFDVLRTVDAAQNGSRKEVVFIDGSLTDIDDLIADIGDGVEIVVLDGNADGLDQIVAWAAQNADFDALHIISHGAEGAVYLGDMTLNSETVVARADDLAAIGASLTESGDILLYGCRVAGGDGKAFADALASATGADIAASLDDTGASNLGGDWELEYATGALEGAAYSSSYEHLLATDNMDSATASGTTVTSSVDGVGYTIATSSGGSWFEFSGQTVTYTSGGSGTVPFIGGHFWGQATGDGTSYTFTFDSPVSITSIGMLSVSSESGATYVFSDTTSGSSNSNVNVAFDSLDGVTMTMGGGYHATNVSLGWSAVSSFTVTLTNGDGNMRLAFDNLVASAAPANNAPTLSGAPSSVTVTEDVSTNIDLSGITVADSDPDTLTVTLTATAGVMTASSSGGVTVGGSGTGTLTLSGSAANINTYLDTTTNVSYQGASNANGNSAATISAKVNDGTVDSSTSSISVNITAVNDVPTVSGAPSDVTVTEDQESNIDLSSVSFADVDGDTLTVTLTASAGTFSTPADGAGVGGGVTETLVSATQITLVGTAADINTYLSAPTSIKYTPAAGVSGQDQATITVSATDGNGGSLSSNPSINVDVTAVNDAPVLTGLDGTPSFTEGGSAVVFDSDVTVSDVELAALNGGNGNFAGATLVLVRNGGANAVDTFSINTGGSLTVAGSNISAGGSVIASFDTSSAGQLTVTFQDNGTTPTTALVNEVMQAIRYSNASNDPGSSVQIDWTFSDGNSGSAQGSGGALTATGSTAVTITNVNDAPTLAATGQDPTYVEGAGSADLFSGVTADTIEATNTTDRFAAMTMTVTNVSDGASEIIRFDGSDVALTNGNSVTTATNGLSVSVSVTGSTATLSFTGASLTNAQMQTLVDSMGYRNTSDNPTTAGNRVVTITGVTDNGGTANSGANSVAPNLTSTVSLTGVNDAPVIGNIAGDNTGVQPGTAANIDKDGNFTISNADSADYNGGSLVITPNGGNSASGNFAVDGTNVTAGGDGTIAAGQTIAVGGVAIGTVDGTNNGQGGNTLTISLNANATDARVQTLVRNLQWSASAGSGAQSFDLTINDNDGTANSGAESASATFSVTLGNPPSIAGISGDSVNFTEGDSAVVLDASGDLTITDADSPASYDGGNLTVTVSGNAVAGEDILTLDTSGTVSLAATTAGSNVSVGGVVIGTLANSIAAGNDLVVNLNNNATVARIQTLARAVAYDNGSSENPTASTRSVSMTVTDNDGLASSTVVSSVVVSAVNDAPAATGVPTSITVTEDTAGNVDLSAITLTDVDAGSNNITVTITASAGTLAASSSGGVTIGGSSTGTLTLTGTVANIDTYLNTASNIQYTGAANATGNSAATLTITANDGGNSGSGGGTNVALGSVAVNITGVNDAPTMGSLSGDSVNYTAGQTIRVDSGQNALVTDIDSTHFNAGTLTVSITAGGIASEDILSLVTSGTNVTLSGTTAGSTVSVGGTQIGTLGNAIGAGTNLVINFDTQDATPARVQELVRAVSYRNNAGTPTVANRTVTFTLSDGSDSSSVTSTIVVSQPPATTTPPPPAPPPTAPPPVVNVPPILQAPGTSGGGDSGTPVSNAIVQNTSGGGSAGPIIAGGTIQTTVTGNLGNTSPIGNSGTPVSAGLSSSGVAGGLGGGNTIIGGGAANGGGFGSGQGVGLGGGLGGASSGGAGVGGVAGGFGGSGVGGASNAGGGVGGAPSGGIGSGAPGGADSGNAAGSGLGGGLGGQPGDGLNGENSDEQTPGQGQPSDDGTPAGESEGDDQAALDDTENHNVMAWNDDFAGQLAAFGELSEREARQLAAALEIHKVPA